MRDLIALAVFIRQDEFNFWDLKPSGIETGRKNEDDLTEENEIFL